MPNIIISIYVYIRIVYMWDRSYLDYLASLVSGMARLLFNTL